MRKTAFLGGLVSLFILMGCQTAVPVPNVPTLSPTRPPSQLPTAVPAPTLVPDSGWQSRQPGLDQRTINIFEDDGDLFETLYLVRVDPAAYRVTVAYHPGQPQTLAAWLAETEALFVVNGGFFTETYTATGLVVVEGQVSGAGYGDFAGMLAVSESGTELRWLAERPFDPAEPLLYALQSFPLLVKQGGEAGFLEEDGQTARRTVIAQDKAGRLLFIVAPWGQFTLFNLSNYLAGADLELEMALNLDGGASSGLLWANKEGIPAMTAVPLVIAVSPR